MSWLHIPVTLALALSACATQPQKGSGDTVRASPETPKIEECSLAGSMACKAAALLSGGANRQATCVVSRSATGGRVENCGSVERKTSTTGGEQTGSSFVSVRLGWADNSNNESRFVIERCDQIGFREEGEKKTTFCTGNWTAIGSVAANVTSYVDNTALANRTYLYRVKAANDLGSSSYTNEALITAPSK